MDKKPSKQDLVVSYLIDVLDKHVHEKTGAPYQQVIDIMLEARAFDFKTKEECEEYIEKLKTLGEVFECRRGFLKKI